jgi:hypothetical protein
MEGHLQRQATAREGRHPYPINILYNLNLAMPMTTEGQFKYLLYGRPGRPSNQA